MSFEHEEQMRATEEAAQAAKDQRRGVPSASGMERLFNCPPSFEMEHLSPPEEESEDAASGTRIHAVLALEASTDTLNSDELETCDRCNEASMRVIQDWNGSNGMVTPDHTLYEKRLGLTVFGAVFEVTPESDADFIFTGQADLILVKGSRALVIDYKTGRGETPVAQDNPQLAALAVLVWQHFPAVQEVRVVIVQPWAGKPTIADYSTNALKLAKGWLLDALDAASKATPDDAKAGEWCKYCKAKAQCPAFRNAALAQVERLNPITIAGADDETQRRALFARAMELSPEALAAAVRGLGMVKRFVQAIDGAARERARQDAEFQQFFVLREKKGRRSISDVGKVFSACHSRGVTAEDFTALCSIGLGDVKSLLRKATGSKGKVLDAINDEVLTGAVEVGKPTFELVPANELEGGGE